jgi:type IV pilus biogenesis protein CpaD/CtpE
MSESIRSAALSCRALAVAAVALMALSACDVTTPSQLKTGQMQLADIMKTAELDPRQVNSERVGIIAGDYTRNNEGPMRLVVPFQPGNPLNEVAAEAEGKAYAQAFAHFGVKRLDVATAASADPNARAVVSYMALKALPPRNCLPSSSMFGADTFENTRDYEMGCSMYMSEAHMIGRPADLMGVGGNPEDEAKRVGTIVDHYRSGVTNPPLSGLNASGVGTGSVSGGGTSAGAAPSGGGS